MAEPVDDIAPDGPSRSRRLPKVIAAVVIVALVAVAVFALRPASGSDDEATATTAPKTETATVTKTTLTSSESLDGTLGYEDAGTLTAQRSGTVTSVAATGKVVKQGQVLYRIDNEPTILLTGSVPAYRELSTDSDDGPDVRQLEENLVALGFGGDLTVDESFTSATADAVEAWEDSIGLVQATSGIGSGNAELPSTAVSMLRRIEPVEGVSAVTSVDAKVYRTDKVPSDDSAGLSVKAAEPHLLETIGGTVASGRFLDEESSKLPTVVLGSVAAERLGISGPGVRVWLGDHWYQVIGVLDPIDLAKDIDRAALIGEANARETFDIGDSPETIYLQVAPDDVEAVQSVIPATVNPANPDQVEVSRPSDAIEARAAASNAFTSLFLGLGAVALLVGGVGIANVMVISVLERRSEIGLRRALGATKRHVSIQFLAEALLLSAIGGTCGVILGAGVTVINAAARGWTPVIPLTAMVGGVGAALLIGAVAGLYPAVRAARLSPTEALRTI